MKTDASNGVVVLQDDINFNRNREGVVGSPGKLIAASERLSQWVYSLLPNFLIEGYAKPGALISGRLYEDSGQPFGLPLTATTDSQGRWRIEFAGVKSNCFYRLELETSSTSNLDLCGYFCVDTRHPSYQALAPFSVSDQLVAMR